jgi:hypothetical protein
MGARRILGVVAMLALTAGPGWTAPLLQPHVYNWQHFFRLDWEVGEQKGKPLVWGHLVNAWSAPAGRVQLLIEGLDDGGRVVNQKVAWLGRTLEPGATTYFSEAAPGPAATYRVSVFAFDWLGDNR